MRAVLLMLMTCGGLAGCGKEYKPAPIATEADKPKPSVESAGKSGELQSGESFEVVAPASAPVFNESDYKEVLASFGSNPARAQREQSKKRWRFEVRVDDVARFGGVGGVVLSGKVGWALIVTRSQNELEKFSRGRVSILEASIREFNPNVYDGVVLYDAVFISDTPLK